ncbi:MAG TPA: hypothetical protein VFH89_04855 [Sphingomicrobium sp.]|nr:hypothetical protein [Sphingomicrobium sp.]
MVREREIIEKCRELLAIERELLDMYGQINSFTKGTNVAMLFVRSGDDFVYSKTAFSANSDLTPEAAELVVRSVPVDKKKRIFRACIANNSRCANHTEPKLFYDFFSTVRLPELQDRPIDSILLATERDCCPSCNHNSVDGIKALQGMLAMTMSDFDLKVVEVNHPNPDRTVGRLIEIPREH